MPVLALLLSLVTTVASVQPPSHSSPLEQHCAASEIQRHGLQQTIQRLQRERTALIRQLVEAQAKLRELSDIERAIERNQVPEAPL